MAFDQHRAPGPAQVKEPKHKSQALDVDGESDNPSMTRVVAGGSERPAGSWPTTRDYTYEPPPDPYDENDYFPN